VGSGGLHEQYGGVKPDAARDAHIAVQTLSLIGGLHFSAFSLCRSGCMNSMME
jgi:hypothetical protein